MPIVTASLTLHSLIRHLCRGLDEAARRPIRSGLAVATVILGAVMLMTMVSLSGISRQLRRQDALIMSMVSAPVDDRSTLLASHLDVIADVRSLYFTFASGMTMVAGLLLLAFWLARRDSAARDLILRQHLIMQKSPDAIFLVGLDGVIRDVNAAGEMLFGYEAREMIGHPITDFNPPDTKMSTLTSFRRSIELGSNVDAGIRVVRRDGTVAIADFTILVLDGEEPIVVSIGRDVTRQHAAAEELARSQEQLRQAQKMEAIGLLAGGVAHDFNNALTVINGYTELILETLPEGAPHRSQLVQIGQAGERAAGITRQLLAFSRRDRSRLQILDLNAVIEGIARMLERLLGEDITLRVTPGVALGRILADPGQIEQVLMNLAVNARDAMPNGGTLTISTAMVDPTPGSPVDTACVRLTVADTGCGMDDATRRRVFEPFFTTKPPGKGTGLGLSIVFGIVEGIGGVISIDTAPGSGTAFYIDLPEVLDQVTREVATGEPCPAEADPGTILLIEDEVPLRECVKEALVAHGYTVLEAEDGRAGIARASGHHGTLDLVISDLVMPGLSMEEMYAAIKAERPGVLLLCMSGHSDRARIHPLLMSGQVPYIEKPFMPSELVKLIHGLLATGPARQPVTLAA